MAWYSILPSHLTTYETWIIRAFLLLALLNLLPWLLAFVYDLLYYICRRTWHEIPVWGGRARGLVRPRAPTLRRDRRLSFRDIVSGGSGATGSGAEGDGDDDETAAAGSGPRSRAAVRGHSKNLSSQSIQEEHDET